MKAFKLSLGRKLTITATPALIRRFLMFVTMVDGCWEWTGHITRDGYGQFKLAGKTVRAHRLAYAMFKGRVDTRDVHHECYNSKCVNPAHLTLIIRGCHTGVPF